MNEEKSRQVAGVIAAFVIGIGIVLALLKTQATVNDEYVDYSAVVIYKEFSGDVGGSPGIDMWQIRLETKRLLVVPSSVLGGHKIGDCVTVRMISVGSVFGRGMRIIGPADDCESKAVR